VGPNLSRVGFDLLRLCYTSKHAEEIDALERVFNVIPIVISKSTEIKGVHGVPSGSVFTNYVDSVVHRFLQWDCSRTLGLTLLPNCQVQGDDGLLKFTAETDLDKILRCYESFGLTANIEKQFIGDDDCTYLQRYHHVSQVGGMYPTFRALNSLLGQERFHSEEVWGPDMVILRALMVLENCKHHPLFVDLVKFVMSGDKYGLGSRWPGGMDGYLHRTNVIAKAARVPGFIPSYNQERNVKGLSSFKVVRVIREAT
jgi:hypothetical protein